MIQIANNQIELEVAIFCALMKIYILLNGIDCKLIECVDVGK